MASSSRRFNQADFDPMQDDFDNSNYENQQAGASSGDLVKLNNSRLYVKNIPKVLNEEGLKIVFSKYGTVTHSFFSNDPNRRFALITYETPADARHAMMKLDKLEPLKMTVRLAHEPKSSASTQNTFQTQKKEGNNNQNNRTATVSHSHSSREKYFDNVSVISRNKNRKPEDLSNGEILIGVEDNKMDIGSDLGIEDPDLLFELERIKLESLRLHQEELQCQQRLLIKQHEKRAMASNMPPSNRCVVNNGRIMIKSINEGIDRRDPENFAAGAGDSNDRDACAPPPPRWDQLSSGSSTPSTCKLCSNRTYEHAKPEKICHEIYSKAHEIASKKTCTSKATEPTRKQSGGSGSGSKHTETVGKKSDKKLDASAKPSKTKSAIACDLNEEEEVDEINRLIQLRNTDYADVVDEQLKIVVAQAGYPKSKMRLRQIATFQRCLAEVTDMQVKAGLLKRSPAFFDYYLNRGAIVCICRDVETRDWMVRISPGLQERMAINLILLKAKVKRICLAVLRIPQPSWPATAQDAFKLLHYFNPTLKINLWKIYSQKMVDGVETTFFMIDRVSGELIRGPSFNNIIEYDQMDLELTGYTEIYYECLLSDLKEDVSSIASRVKLLEEIKSENVSPRDEAEVSAVNQSARAVGITPRSHARVEHTENYLNKEEPREQDDREPDNSGHKITLEEDIQHQLDVQYICENKKANVWSDETNFSDHETEKDQAHMEVQYHYEQRECIISTSAVSEKTESIIESNDNLNQSRNLFIDSNRGIAYHRRTNYLHVEPELKVAVTLDGYPQDKLEGSHIRRLKHLFKEYLHKDMKNQRFGNLIIPKFQDIYLSNGAVIYICDSLETKDYLTDILPKIINATGLKLTFRDVKNLVRYTRIVMRLPKEQAHVESKEILNKLQASYPGLKLNCWKYYSDVAGKQKRQFGVDPESLSVIKSPDFNPTYEGEAVSFRIIDRQKRDVRFDEQFSLDVNDQRSEDKKYREMIVKNMYVPIDPDITNSPLTRIRTNHYTDLIADDLKLYVSPTSYPESRVDESLFHTIKKTIESIILESHERGDTTKDQIPKFHDMYLFDGVIFIICVNMMSRSWIEKNLIVINCRLGINLKCTEFRGAVGIISLCVKTDKDIDEVCKILQKLNPRLRIKFWRTISTVQTNNKLDVVLQIDKLSALVMTSPGFNKLIEGAPIQFDLGHLQSMLKPKASLEELSKLHEKKQEKNTDVPHVTKSKVAMQGPKDKNFDELMRQLCREHPALKIEDWNIISLQENANHKICDLEIDEISAKIIEKEDYKLTVGDDKLYFFTDVPSHQSAPSQHSAPPLSRPVTTPRRTSGSCGTKTKVITLANDQDLHKMILSIPMNILPDNREDLNIIFDLLEDKNPGLNTELWQVYTDAPYPNNGKFTLFVDKQSKAVIEAKNFDPTVGGQKLKFYF